MREEFDFDVALAALQDGQGLTGKDGILTPLVKQLTEAALQAELEAHLKADKSTRPWFWSVFGTGDATAGTELAVRPSNPRLEVSNWQRHEIGLDRLSRNW